MSFWDQQTKLWSTGSIGLYGVTSGLVVTIFPIFSTVYNNPRVQGKKTMLEKLGEVVDILKKGGSGSDQVQQLAAVLFITRLLEEKGGQEKNSMRSDSAQTVR